jgi:release factor glutamine methyltransferase
MKMANLAVRRLWNYMRRVFKYIASRTYKPLLVTYLASTRLYWYKGIRLEIPPEVFHPAFFFSTKFLLKHLLTIRVEDKSFLELGAGSGLISFAVARKGANVTATDINQTAIRYLQKNSRFNQTGITVVESDLFDSLPQQVFDIIAINPPYYKKQPLTERDHAWYCGENGEYFQRLFADLARFIDHKSDVFMVLSDGCDLSMIKTAAVANHFTMKVSKKKKNLLEEQYIFRIERIVK